MDVDMRHDLKIEAEKGVLNLRGRLTISYAAELKEVLLEAMEGVSSLTLQCDQVESADLSALQLMCSAHRYAVMQGKEICFGSPISDALTQTVRDAGYAKTTGCSMDRRNSCLCLKYLHNEQPAAKEKICKRS
jgi:anti-anti-sigma regulatory factor